MEPSDKDFPLKKVSVEDANDFMEVRKKKCTEDRSCSCSLYRQSVSSDIFGRIIGGADWKYFRGCGCIGWTGMPAWICGCSGIYIYFLRYADKRFEFLENECFETAYGVEGLAKEKLKNYEGTFTRGIAVGVVLCIVAAIPLLVAACMDAPDAVCTSFVSLLLILVACGVYMIIRVGMIKGSYDILLQEGDYTISEKKLKKKSDAFSGAYWCIATAIYLGWSFWTMRWDFTWIIWPVAGVLFAAVSGIFRAVMQNEKKK